jgi:hypothetical protein
MQLVSAGSNHTAHMKPLIEQPHGLSLRAHVCFFFPHKNLNLPSKQTTDGGSTASGENLHLLERLPG